MKYFIHLFIVLAIFSSNLCAQNRDSYEELTPYQGVSATKNRVENETMIGKILCGYQGWFTAEGDGSFQPWIHYGSRGRFEPGFTNVDMWPDMSEMDDDEKYPTPFKFADGGTAHVFSSQNPKTVRRHFQWMQDYGLDGVFLQRFTADVRNARGATKVNNVMLHVQESANESGRCWALMYDLSGMRAGEIESVAIPDWKRLVDKMKLGKDKNDKSYLRHNGKPVVTVWGIGFNDNRQYTLQECMKFIEFLKDDEQYGGYCVMIGVPTYWREMRNDTLNDPLLHEICKKADIVSPWKVGRYSSPKQAEEHIKSVVPGDVQWCKENQVEYLPVVFPGFSWHNMHQGRSPSDQIPRRKGEFLETQMRENINAGAVMIYQAMFDEIDEGTAIFKVANEVPVGSESKFVTYEGLPSDFYLKLVGQWTKQLRESVKK